MKRWTCWVVLALCAALARADWQTFLREEPARQKRDDTPYVTLDRLLKAEREAMAEDKPYLSLAATLQLNVTQWYLFDFDKVASSDPLPDLTKPSKGWAPGQAAALLKARMEQLVPLFPLYAKTSAEPFRVALVDGYMADAWPNMSALAFFVNQLNARGKTIPEAMLKAARDSGDAMLEGTLRLREIMALPRARWAEALAALEGERLWPADVLAVLRMAQAELEEERKEPNLFGAVRLLTEARDFATLYAIKSEAQGRLNRIRQAELVFDGLPRVVLPGEPIRLKVRHRNVRGAAMAFQEGKRAEVPLKLSKAKPYDWGETVVELPALPPGKHEVTFRYDNTFEGLPEVRQEHTFHACTFTVATVGQQLRPSAEEAGKREAFAYAYVVVDLRTGAPIPGATVALLRRWRDRLQEKEEAVWSVTTDAMGLARVPKPETPKAAFDPLCLHTLRVSARGETLETPQNEPSSLTADTVGDNGEAYVLRTFTDRALYRPGETVQAQFVLYKTEGGSDAYAPAAKAQGKLTVVGRAEQGERKLLEKNLTFSERGACAETMALPKDFKGRLSFCMKVGDKTLYEGGVTVAEFKAPNFTVTLEREKTGAPPTEPVRYKGTAIDLSGTPLTGASVAWEVRGEGEPVRGTATVGADGTFAFAAQLPKTDRDQRVSASARVLNANGERQEERHWDWLPRYGYTVTGKAPDWIVEGEPFEVTLESERAVGGTLAAQREATKAITRVAFEKPGPVRLTLPSGAYTLTAESGPVTNRIDYITVLPRDGRLGDAFGKGVEALLRTRQNAPFTLGQTVELFAGIRGEGPAFLMVSTRAGVERILPLASPFQTLTIEESLRDGFALTVYGFDKGRFCAETQTYEVKPPETLKVEAVRFAEVARPGSAQTWELTVDDPAAELVVTCYDKALDALSFMEWKPFAPRSSYWLAGDITSELQNPSLYWLSEPLPHNYCEDRHLVEYVMEPSEDGEEESGIVRCVLGSRSPGTRSAAIGRYDANPLGDRASAHLEKLALALDLPVAAYGRPRAEEDSGASLAPIRANFARTALWAPQKRLENGKAIFTFALPDSLTTWKLMAYAYTPDGRNGTLVRDCVARLDVMLKPYLPRTLRVGDRLTLQVQLSNTTDKPLTTWAELNRAERRRVVLPAKGSATVAWDVAAQTVPGTQVFEFATEGDAVRLELPVRDDRVTMEDVYPLTLVDTKPATVTVAEPAPLLDLAQRWDHAPAAAVAESLAAFFAEPEAGNDDAFARLAALLLLQQMKAAPEGADVRADALLDRLLTQRTPEGLWPWFPQGRGDVWVSAEICLGVARLHRLGIAPKPLEKAVRETLARNQKALPFAVWAYAIALLDPTSVRTDATLVDRLFRAYREAGSVQERRMLALAAQRLGVALVAEQGLKDTLEAMNASETWGAWWPQERTWWRRWHTPIESHALGLEQLRASGRDAEAKAATRWLLQHRRLNGWGTCRATLAAAFALCGEPSFGEAKPARAPNLRVTTRRVSDTSRALTFAREAPGLSFGSVVATYRLPLAQVPPPRVEGEAALTLTRTLEPAEPKVGDDVTVTLTLTAPQPMSHVRLRDERPANTEPVKALPWWDVASGGYARPDDTGTDVFFAELPRGVTTFRYRLKATHAGQCRPGLATAAPTVAPDFAARTDSFPLTVR